MVIDPSAFEPEGDEHQNRERWKITDASSADWALRKLAQARSRVAEHDALAAAEERRLHDWHRAVCEPVERDIEYFTSILRDWHEEQLAEDPKRKTISLPAGKLSAAKNPDRVEVFDPETFIPWALENKPDWVRTKYEPAKTEIKQAGGVVPETGEIAPGVTVLPGDMRWKAETE
jgi:hypothetical protein